MTMTTDDVAWDTWEDISGPGTVIFHYETRIGGHRAYAVVYGDDGRTPTWQVGWGEDAGDHGAAIAGDAPSLPDAFVEATTGLDVLRFLHRIPNAGGCLVDLALARAETAGWTAEQWADHALGHASG